MRPHLLVAVSSHGFGHFAQTVPVLEALRRRLPELRLTLRTGLPESVLRGRLTGPFEVVAAADDFGMVNTSPFEVDASASARRYRQFHADWDRRVSALSRELAACGPSVVLADIPYLTLAAAAAAGVPSVAFCSLNWVEIYRHYCGGLPEAERILGQMLEAYGSADVFLVPEPSMPMHGLANTRRIGPVAVRYPERRDELRRRLGLPPDATLVLVSMGGIEHRLSMETWPRWEGAYWIVPEDWGASRSDAFGLERIGGSFAEVLPSVDLLITKPGYGSFAEAAAAGVPVAYVPREDWPESEYLVRWLQRHGACAPVPRDLLRTGRFGDTLELLLRDGSYPPVEPAGIDMAVDVMCRKLVNHCDNRGSER